MGLSVIVSDQLVIQFLYLVSPSARKDHHGAADHGHTKSHRVRDRLI